MNIVIRRFQPEDYERVHELHLSALRSVPNLVLKDGPMDEDLLDIETEYPHTGGDFLVMENETGIIGMGAIRKKDAQTGEIRRMRIDPQYWKKGLGQRMLTRLEDIAKGIGYTKLVLDTSVHQIAAQKLYEKNHYIETGRAVLHDLECILYEKKIA